MKRLIMIGVIAIIFTGSLSFAHEEKKEPQKFNVTITITFKAMSMKEIADKEEKLQKLIGDAELTVEFEKICPVCNSGIFWNGSNNLYLTY